jgi:hypothetical protein
MMQTELMFGTLRMFNKVEMKEHTTGKMVLPESNVTVLSNLIIKCFVCRQVLYQFQMAFNIKKCKVMHVGNNRYTYEYKMQSHSIEEVHTEKDLGVLISSDLKVSPQCISACARANRVLGMIGRTIVNKTTDVMVQLYKTLVRPHLEYCSSAWSPYYNKDKELIKRVQH